MLKYETIAYDVRKKILLGEYKKNSQLPLEKEMCDIYDVSRITVKKAIDCLVQEGLVVKRRGSGTFVKDFDSYEDNNFLPNRLVSFLEKYADKKTSNDIIIFDIIKSPHIVIEKLNIKDVDFVYRIGRLRKLDNKPHYIKYSYIPINLIMGLTIVHAVDSISNYVECIMGMKIQSGHKEIFADNAEDEIALLLGIANNSAILRINQIKFLETGQPFEYAEYYYPPRQFKYKSIDIR